MYGQVRDAATGQSVLVTNGTLAWVFQPDDGGAVVTVTTQLTNIHDQLSYVLEVPVETILGSLVASTNTLRMMNPPIQYSRATLYVNGQPAYLQLPLNNTVVMNAANRGWIERVDVTLQNDLQDSDGDGIPDGWEMQYGLNPYRTEDGGEDADQDGLSNWQEFFAGTNPTNDQSNFVFTRIEPHPLGGIRLDWLSASNRTYVLQRSHDLGSAFVDIQADIGATPPLNSYLDTTATGAVVYFYRLCIQEAPVAGSGAALSPSMNLSQVTYPVAAGGYRILSKR